MPENSRKISIARDFSETPYGRYESDGQESGQVFREKMLRPALEQGPVELNIDGVAGLPSSFWEESLGGLIRSGYPLDELKTKLTIACTDPELKTFVRSGWRFAEEASEKLNAN